MGGPIKIGNVTIDTIGQLKVGSTNVQKAYVGSVQVFPAPTTTTTTTAAPTTTSTTTTTTTALACCYQYEITNYYTTSKTIFYTDCDGTPSSISAPGNGLQTIITCAVEGSISFSETPCNGGTSDCIAVVQANEPCGGCITTTTTTTAAPTTTTTSTTTTTTTAEPTTTTSTTTTTTTAEPCTECGDTLNGSYSGLDFTTQTKCLDLISATNGGEITISYDAVDRPNRFNIYEVGGLLVATSGWVGSPSSTPGPWNPPGPGIGTFSFIYDNTKTYELRVDIAADTISDTWTISVTCGPVPTTTTTTTSTTTTTTTAAPTTTTSTTTTTTTAEPCTGCGGTLNGSYAGLDSTTQTKCLDLTSATNGGQITISYDAIDRPNRFNIYEVGGSLIATSGWVGSTSSVPGPWNPPGPGTGTFSFIYDNTKSYELRVDIAADNISDTWAISVTCGPVPTTTTTTTTTTSTTTTTTTAAPTTTTTTSTTTTTTTAEPCTGCGDTLNGSYAGLDSTTQIKCLDLTSAVNGGQITISYDAVDRPNRFNIYEVGGSLIATSGWVGSPSSTPGPWNPPGPGTGTFSFIYDNTKTYELRVEISADTISDTWAISVTCGPVPTTTTTTTAAPTTTTTSTTTTTTTAAPTTTSTTTTTTTTPVYSYCTGYDATDCCVAESDYITNCGGSPF
jgi:hypothetical protein